MKIALALVVVLFNLSSFASQELPTTGLVCSSPAEFKVLIFPASSKSSLNVYVYKGDLKETNLFAGAEEMKYVINKDGALISGEPLQEIKDLTLFENRLDITFVNSERYKGVDFSLTNLFCSNLKK